VKHELFDIWETTSDRPTMRWHAMMVNYVAHFETKELAESFVAAIQKARAQDAKSVANNVPTRRSK
jgi:hypothetical protein